ncbi:MAG: FKBP-type peptidyl-prolyl cis-trans isomerase [Propionibacteriaceae bacterium]|jgi:peptidylprolyl isomerase|nr:FKBP-type peptidyl-prolyl cis-trans isomerase [Propionibacteriaceae bacterium]
MTAAALACCLALGLGLVTAAPGAQALPTADPTSAATSDTEATPTDETDATDETDTTDETDATDETDDTEAEEELPAIDPSYDLSGITVEGEPGEKPTVTVPFPWAINRSQNIVLNEGTGDFVLPNDLVRVNYIGVDGRTGEVFDNSYDSGEPVAFALSGVVTGFKKGLVGQRVGSRILLAMPSTDGYGDTGSGDLISAGDSLVFVAEIVSASRHSVSGTAAASPDGLPEVTGDLKPEVTLPVVAKQPDELQTVTIIEGDGPAIADIATVGYALIQVNYAEYTWTGDTLTFIRQTYGTSSGPLTNYLYGSVPPATLSAGQTVPAWITGLSGVKEGSRVLIVAPPEQGYPDGNDALGIKKGAYSVWVVDVLFAG